MPITLRQLLDLDVVRRGSPHVVAGSERLDVPVRWVHALELTDVGRLLRGGELVLSTGIALPDSPAELDAYVASLAHVGVAGLAVELGRRYTEALPAALVAAAPPARAQAGLHGYFRPGVPRGDDPLRRGARRRHLDHARRPRHLLRAARAGMGAQRGSL